MGCMVERVFITGGLGYVGGRCSRSLAKAGYHLSIGSRAATEAGRPSWLLDGRLVNYSTSMDSKALLPILTGVDTVIHMASPNEIVSARFPEQAIEENCIGTYRLCLAARDAKVKHFVFFSTAHIYGSPLQGSYTELSVPEPTHPYAYSHLAAEQIVRSFAGPSSIPRCTVIRMTNSFGAPERLTVDRWTLLVNDLCKQAVEKSSLTLNSDGMAFRDFVTLTDVETALLLLLGLEKRSPFEIYNLGSGESTRVIDMAKLIASVGRDVLGIPLPITLGSRQDSAPELFIDVSKLRSRGMTWRKNFSEEIANTLKACQQLRVG